MGGQKVYFLELYIYLPISIGGLSQVGPILFDSGGKKLVKVTKNQSTRA